MDAFVPPTFASFSLCLTAYSTTMYLYSLTFWVACRRSIVQASTDTIGRRPQSSAPSLPFHCPTSEHCTQCGSTLRSLCMGLICHIHSQCSFLASRGTQGQFVGRTLSLLAIFLRWNVARHDDQGDIRVRVIALPLLL